MKQNENVKINGEKAVLIPYEAHHVPKYHEWMKSEELQELTASEPLSLDQEYEMQKSWRDDENKCTYIVAEKKKYLHENSESEIKAMVGDVNLFFNEQEDKSTAEIEIMIAEKDARGKGIGKEALLLMMRYGFEDLMVQRYTAKIGYSNHPSLAMFQKLGFVEISRSDVFKEVTLELQVDSEVTKLICDQTNTYLKRDKGESGIKMMKREFNVMNFEDRDGFSIGSRLYKGREDESLAIMDHCKFDTLFLDTHSEKYKSDFDFKVVCSEWRDDHDNIERGRARVVTGSSSTDKISQ